VWVSFVSVERILAIKTGMCTIEHRCHEGGAIASKKSQSCFCGTSCCTDDHRLHQHFLFNIVVVPTSGPDNVMQTRAARGVLLHSGSIQHYIVDHAFAAAVSAHRLLVPTLPYGYTVAIISLPV
jgi:hypothetical protein